MNGLHELNQRREREREEDDKVREEGWCETRGLVHGDRESRDGNLR